MMSYSQPWATWMTCAGAASIFLNAYSKVSREGLYAGLLGGDDVVELDADQFDVLLDQVVLGVAMYVAGGADTCRGSNQTGRQATKVR
jgi:hypothetical protein